MLWNVQLDCVADLEKHSPNHTTSQLLRNVFDLRKKTTPLQWRQACVSTQLDNNFLSSYDSSLTFRRWWPGTIVLDLSCWRLGDDVLRHPERSQRCHSSQPNLLPPSQYIIHPGCKAYLSMDILLHLRP